MSWEDEVWVILCVAAAVSAGAVLYSILLSVIE